MSSKLREALEEIHCQIINRLNGNLSETKMLLDVKNIINKALAEPPRNCDVGTAEEQEVRFRNYCWNHSSRDKNMECQCPIDTEGRAGCKLEWAQMPYETVKTNKTKTNKGE